MSRPEPNMIVLWDLLIPDVNLIIAVWTSLRIYLYRMWIVDTLYPNYSSQFYLYQFQI